MAGILHNKLLTDIADRMEIDSPEYNNFVFHMAEYVPKGILSSKPNLLEKFEAMQIRGKLDVGRYEILKNLARDSKNLHIFDLILKREPEILVEIKTNSGTDSINIQIRRKRKSDEGDHTDPRNHEHKKTYTEMTTRKSTEFYLIEGDHPGPCYHVPEAQIPIQLHGKAAVESPKRCNISNDKELNTDVTTINSTKWAVNILKEWMTEAEMNATYFEEWPEERLNNMLENFYHCLQSKKGKEYSNQSLVNIRAGINRYLNEPPHSRKINFIRDKAFMGSNQVLRNKIKNDKKEQKNIYKQPITEIDMKKLYDSGVFSTERPDTLQNKVQFEIMLQLGFCGREGLRSLKKNSFKLEINSDNRKYVTMIFNESESTHSRMYELPDKSICPVASFEKYLSKLSPYCDNFFQRPLAKINNENIWYSYVAVGVNTLSNLMPILSKQANLSKRYTNYCVRATIGANLQRAGNSIDVAKQLTEQGPNSLHIGNACARPTNGIFIPLNHEKTNGSLLFTGNVLNSTLNFYFTDKSKQ